MHESLDASTIIFAVLAIFVIWKLRSVLGTRTGAEKPPRPGAGFRQRETAPAAESDRVVRLPGAAERAPAAPPPHRWTGFAEPGTPVAAGLDAIAAAEPTFAVRPFLEGAKSAYEMIISAFAANDRKTLETLLAKDVFDSFSAAIDAREARHETVKTTLVSIDDERLEDAQLRARSAQLSVRFIAKLITTTLGADGAPVAGSSDKVTEANDIWTFARDVGIRDPNWKLVATQTGH